MVEGIEFGKWYRGPATQYPRYFFIQYIHSNKRFGVLHTYGMRNRLTYDEYSKAYIKKLFKTLEPASFEDGDIQLSIKILIKDIFDFEEMPVMGGIRAMVFRGIN